MPVKVQKEIGHSIRDLQKKRDPGITKPLKYLSDPEVSEIIVDARKGAFRTVYTVEFKDALAVLHTYPSKRKNWFLAASTWHQIFCLHLRLAYRQWSLVPEQKIFAASLSNSQFLNLLGYIPQKKQRRDYYS